MKDKIFEAFLRRQFEEGKALAASSDALELIAMPDGDPPSRYIAHFERCNGLVRDARGAIVEFDKFAVGIWFADDHLRRVNPAQVLTYLGPHPDPWHPNLRPPFICTHIEPGTGLVDILYACFEIWTWNLFATHDEGLNHAASQRSRKQDRNRFPIDRRPLQRRTAPSQAKPATAREVV